MFVGFLQRGHMLYTLLSKFLLIILVKHDLWTAWPQVSKMATNYYFCFDPNNDVKATNPKKHRC